MDRRRRSGQVGTSYSPVFGDLCANCDRGCTRAGSEPRTIDLGRTLYRTLVRVYLEHYEALEGDPSFGAIEFALRPLFPEMIGQSIDNIDVGEVIDASHHGPARICLWYLRRR